MNNVQQARINKKTFFFNEREEFMSCLFENVARVERRAIKIDLKPCIRLNGTSDINWERIGFKVAGRFGSIMEHFPHVQFYDYTKRPLPKRLRDCPPNYDLTFSRSETNDKECLEALAGYGARVAVVFADPISRRPHHWMVAHSLTCGLVDGDQHDLRFLDPQGVIVALSAKGDAKKDESGFVI